MSETRNDDAVKAAVQLIRSSGPEIGSIWRHRKGGVYEVIGNAIREADLVPVVVYQDTHPRGWAFDTKLCLNWSRPLTEFLDGRFVMVAPAPGRPGVKPEASAL